MAEKHKVLTFDKTWDDLTEGEREVLRALADRLELADRAKAKAEAEYNEARAKVLKEMLAKKIKKFSGPRDDHQVIQNLPEKLNLIKLREQLSDSQWMAVTTRTFSKERLAAALRSKKIKPQIVTANTEIDPGAPFTKSTARKD